jgi:hypothetical protein
MYGSREHLNELNVRPLPQALPTHDVVAESHIMRERLEIPIPAGVYEAAEEAAYG